MESSPSNPLPAPLAAPVEVELPVFEPHPCMYLPGQMATTRGVWADKIPGALYHAFMDRGFRRSGKFIYQPVCESCRQCVPIRVPVAEFAPSKSQRRSWRKNMDLRVSVGVPEPSKEKFALYRKFLARRHADDEPEYEAFRGFLYDSPVDTGEFTYRMNDGTLAGVGICDLCPQSLSSVYFYFDPELARRSLGVYSALVEIDFARKHGIPYYYQGYWVQGCEKMSYKSAYRPCEVLDSAGIWVPME